MDFQILCMYFTGQINQINNFINLLTQHERKWPFCLLSGINSSRNFMIRETKTCGRWDSTSRAPLLQGVEPFRASPQPILHILLAAGAHHDRLARPTRCLCAAFEQDAPLLRTTAWTLVVAAAASHLSPKCLLGTGARRLSSATYEESPRGRET